MRSSVSATLFPKGSVTGCDFWFLIFDCSSLFFLLIEFHYAFSISYIELTCSVYYHCIWLGFNTLFSCFFPGFTVLSQGISHGIWLLAWEFLLFSSVLLMNLYSLDYSYESLFTYESSYESLSRLLLWRLCSNGCAVALAVIMNFSVESPLLLLIRLNS